MDRFGKYAATACVSVSVVAVLGLALRADVPQVPTGIWMAGGAFGEIPADAASTVLADGRLVVAGGSAIDGQPSAQIVIYSPASSEWTIAGTMSEARAGHTATALADGRVLIAGGRTSAGVTSSIEIYDPAVGASAPAGALSLPRVYHAAARLIDKRVLIVGGSDGKAALAIAEVVDLETGSIVPLSSWLSTPRMKSSATTLLDGHVLVAGGNDGTQDLATAEIFDADLGIFWTTSSMRAPRSGHVAALLPHNNSVLIVGGSSDGTRLASVERFSHWNEMFYADSNTMATARIGALAVPTPRDGVVLVGGGGSADAELYGFATVKTDKDDYAPGETVTITGSGWQPGETVHLTISEYADNHYDFEFQAVADEFGNIVNQEFYPREDETFHHMGMRFYAMAQGIASEAQTTFTDGGTLTITFAGNGSGTVRGAGAGQNAFDCSSNCTGPTYTSNGSVTLTATPAPDSTFVSWSSNVVCDPNPTRGCSVKMDKNQIVTATFNKKATKQDQTITFDALAGKTYRDADFVVTATASSNLAVTFTASGQCTVASGTVHILGAGSCTLTAQQAGDDNYNPAPNVSQSFTIAKATPVITVTGGVFTYDGNPHAGSATATLNGVTVTGTFSFTYNGVGAQPADAGTYNVLASFTSADANCADATGSGTITINKANATVTVNPYTGVYDGQAHGATGSATGIGGTPLSGLDLGQQFTDVPGGTAHWTFAGGTNYEDAEGDVAIVIKKATASIDVTGADVTYDGHAHGATGSATGISGTPLSGLDLGQQFTDVPGGTAHWTFAGGTNYEDAEGDVAIVINRATASVTAQNKTKTYGQANPALDAVVVGAVNGEVLAYSLATPAVQMSVVGDYPITVTLGENPNYDVSRTDGVLTIGKAPAAVKANDETRTYGDANPALDAVVTGTVNSEVLAYSLATSAVQTSGVGDYSIIVTLGANPNYEVSTINGTLTVTKASLTLKANDASRPYGVANPTFNGSYSGQKNGETFTMAFSTAATTDSAVGTYAIEPSATGLTIGNYDVKPINGTLTIAAWSLTGFYQPVGETSSIVSAPRGVQPMVSETTVWNAIKGGQTVPMKFNIYRAVGGAHVTTVADAFSGAGFSAYQLPSCSGGYTDDEISLTDVSTGGTELRYDGTQFIQNWKTPKVSGADLCFRAVITAKDGSTITAFFKVKK